VKPAIRGHFIPAKRGHFKPALTSLTDYLCFLAHRHAIERAGHNKTAGKPGHTMQQNLIGGAAQLFPILSNPD